MQRIVVFVVLGGLALVAGCQRSGSNEGTNAAPSSPAASPSAAPAAAAFDHPSYSVGLEPVGSYKKGEASSFKIVVRTKGEFHINEEYPTKFSATASPGVQYAMPKLARAAQPDAFALKPCASGKDNCTLELTVKFTPEQTGTVQIGGELSVGVCNKDNCLFEKKTLSMPVPVG